MIPFPMQSKAVSSSGRQKTIDSWLEGKGPSQIGKVLRLQKQTITNIVDYFVRGGNAETRLARTDDVNIYVEYCKNIRARHL